MDEFCATTSWHRVHARRPSSPLEKKAGMVLPLTARRAKAPGIRLVTGRMRSSRPGRPHSMPVVPTRHRARSSSSWALTRSATGMATSPESINVQLLRWCEQQRQLIARSHSRYTEDGAMVARRIWNIVSQSVACGLRDRVGDFDMSNRVRQPPRLPANLEAPHGELVSHARIGANAVNNCGPGRPVHTSHGRSGHWRKRRQSRRQDGRETVELAAIQRELQPLAAHLLRPPKS